MSDGPARSSDRGQSTTLDYTLTLAVATLVVTGLFTATGDFVSDRREDVVRTELDVVGEQLAGELTAADRLAQSGERTDALAVNSSLPKRVAGAGYTIEISTTGSAQWLNLSTNNPSVSVSVRVQTATDLAATRVEGGDLTIVYDGSELEVRT